MDGEKKTVVIGSDHFGFQLKNALRDYIRSKGWNVVDMGVDSEMPIDYPDMGTRLAEAIRDGKYDRGILICGTGAGMAIVANKIPGVRAVCIHDPYTAERARASNNAQIATLGSQVIGIEVAKKLIDIWLSSEFQGGRSFSKVEKINLLDEKYRVK